MSHALPAPASRRAHPFANLGFYRSLAILVGIVMPVLSALIYPTYTHSTHPWWVEYTRLIELPFVVCELLVIHVALRRGMDDLAILRALPRDIRIALGVLAVGLTVSSVFISAQPFASITLSVITIIHLRFAAAIYFMARQTGRDAVTAFVPILGLGLIMLAIVTAGRFAFPPPAELVPGGVIEWASALPGFISVRHFGSWTGAVAAGLLVTLLYGKSDRQPVIAALYLLAACLTIWSGTRAAVLAVIVVTTVAAVTLRRLPPRRAVVLAVALTLAGAAIAMFVLPIRDPAFALYTAGDGQNANIATGGRLALWAATIARWMQSPLFGWGSGSTFWEVYVGWSHTQPHNVVLQFLISWGIVGAAGGLWLLGRAILAAHMRGFCDPAVLPLTAVLYALLFQSLLEGMLHYPRFIMVIMIGFAVILARDPDAHGEPLAR